MVILDTAHSIAHVLCYHNASVRFASDGVREVSKNMLDAPIINRLQHADGVDGGQNVCMRWHVHRHSATHKPHTHA